MARYIGFIRGNRGEASRLGSKDSGISASARGWNCGARIKIREMNNGGDQCTVYADQGSNGGDDRWVAQIKHDQEDGYRIEVNPELTKVIPNDDYMSLVQTLIEIMNKDMPPHEKAVSILIELNYKEEDGPND